MAYLRVGFVGLQNPCYCVFVFQQYPEKFSVASMTFSHLPVYFGKCYIIYGCGDVTSGQYSLLETNCDKIFLIRH